MNANCVECVERGEEPSAVNERSKKKKHSKNISVNGGGKRPNSDKLYEQYIPFVFVFVCDCVSVCHFLCLCVRGGACMCAYVCNVYVYSYVWVFEELSSSSSLLSHTRHLFKAFKCAFHV